MKTNKETTQDQEAPVKISKSSKIRELSASGKKNGEIAKILGIRYQFVYNVLHQVSKGE